MKFEKFQLDETILENLHQLKFFRTTDIQYKVIPAVLRDEDVLAIAQTGTGKTAAFAIPLVQRIHSEKTSKRGAEVHALVMVPTRELAQQIGTVFHQISKGTRVKAFAIYGGVETEPQVKQIEQGLDIVIATPGRMFEYIRKSELDLSQVQTLVLDEADRMLDLGFIDDIQTVKRSLPRHHQTLFFSATINPKIKKLAYSQIKSNALRIQISPEQRVSKNVTHFVVQVSMEDKRALLANFVAHHPESKMIIFVRTQVRAERVHAFLEKIQIPSVHFHGGLDQAQRELSLQRFRDGEIRLLVATDVSARGIDLPGIEYVVNFDLPDDPENYVHRVGRTGRGFAKGEAISFCSSEEKEKLQFIEEFLGKEISKLKVSPKDLELKKIEEPPATIHDMIKSLESEFAISEKRKKRPKKS